MTCHSPRAVMGEQSIRWPVSAYVHDRRFSNAVMAMGTDLTSDGVALREVTGTDEEQKELAQSYRHLCDLRDEVIRMRIIPQISEWHTLNPHLRSESA